MRNLIIFICSCFTFYANAQLVGNQNIVTKSIPVESFNRIDLGLYADYEIDMSADPYLEITIDENLLDKVEKRVKGGTLKLDQLEWSQSKEKVTIKIGARGVQKITQSSHATSRVQNLNQDRFTYDAEVGKIWLSGKVSELKLSVGTADIDAEKVDASTASFRFDSWGSIQASVTGDYEEKNENNGRLTVNGEKTQGSLRPKDEAVRFIKFTIKNNSANRHQFYVIGPKPDGSSFSYGFPMMPYQTREKDWTNGTKVYKVNRLGMRKLVKVISLDDEGETVKIFSK